MNDAGREKLVAAALDGVKQVFGRLGYEEGDGLCAMAVLGVKNYLDAERVAKKYEIQINDKRSCDLCNIEGYSELGLMTHYNDHHHFDFLTIARKL